MYSKSNRHTAYWLAAVLLLSLGKAAPGRAQDPRQEQPQSQSKAAQSTQQGEQSSSEQPDSAATESGVFTPSEEISEDLSVSFPIDI